VPYNVTSFLTYSQQRCFTFKFAWTALVQTVEYESLQYICGERWSDKTKVMQVKEVPAISSHSLK